MRILMITQWFDPEPTFKGLLFAQELQRRGHEVRVITGFPNYPGGSVYEGYRIRVFQRQNIEGVSVLRVPLYPSHDGSGTRRILNYFSFALSATIGVLIVRRPEVAYVYHPPATVAFPAFVLKAFKGVPFVYDVQDLWPDTLEAIGMVNDKQVIRVAGGVMTLIYRSATKIVVLSKGFEKALHARAVPGHKIVTIPNWADEKQIAIDAKNMSRARTLGFDGRFTVTFAGNMGIAQALETVLDAAELLHDLPGLRILFVGGGLDCGRLRDEARRRNLVNVEFMSRRPINEIGEILTLSDALLVHLRDDPLFAITIPSKTQAYLMAGRPILMGVRGDASQMVEEAGAGLFFEQENPASLASAVRQMAAMSPQDRAKMGRAGRQFYEDRLSLKRGAAQFEHVLEQARSLKPHTRVAKRLLDLATAATGLALLALPMGVLALLIRLRLGSPVIFRQHRPGLHGEPFEIFKFRTMQEKYGASGELLPDSDRLTRFGRLLRSSSLDELPELWNVIRGDMSLVGPRPLLMRYTVFFSEDEAIRLTAKPGITGWAQINGRNTVSWDERLALDTWYVKNHSLRLDVKILVTTAQRVFERKDVVVDPESVMQNLDDERRNTEVS